MMKKIMVLFLVLLLSISIAHANVIGIQEEDTIPAAPTNLDEQVTCRFTGSTSTQTCYASNTDKSCTGTESCTMTITSVSGSQIEMTACGGTASALIDGVQDYVTFKCDPVTTVPVPTTPVASPTPTPTITPIPTPVTTTPTSPTPATPTASPIPASPTIPPATSAPTTSPIPTTPTGNSVGYIKEQVKCIFGNSNGIQKCSTDDGKFGCSGTGTCVADVYGEKGYKQTWKSSCGGYAYTQIDGNNDYAEFKCVSAAPLESVIVKEQVKCIFDNSNGVQKCYTDDNKFGCSGEGTCVVEVSGEKGSKQIWKSSCSGYAYIDGVVCQGEFSACQGGFAYTIIDGNNDYAEFKCVSKTPLESVIVKEQVKCIFIDSKTMQKCYTDDNKFGCSGEGTCVAEVSGEKGHKQTWKSSCGGYAYTVLDGNNDYAEVKCVSETEVTSEIISGKGFRYAYWQCYNKEEQKPEDDTSCKSSETWQKYAKDFCKDKCYEDKSKCGVNSFSVSEECYLEFEKGGVIFDPSIDNEERKQKEDTTSKKNEYTLICKDSCPLDGKCYPFGYRKEGRFCSDSGAFTEQLSEELACDNNFECSTNVCVDGKCMSSGLIQKIIQWFTGIFG
ncbi:hypothetical protein J4444_02305 [Candidatus Woesearchaeota archaeon]|nr:hypothetical protein [Candidatus Woesearchaeota archaeon]